MAGRSKRHTWRPIEDYRVPWDRLSHSGPRALAQQWTEQRALLDPDRIEAFNERLKREWAIETGLLERVYTLDRGVTHLLIEKGIDSALISHHHPGGSPERTIAMIRDHESAIEGLFDFIKGDRTLSTSYIKELHALMTRNQASTTAIDAFGNAVEVTLLRGEYKRTPNNLNETGSLDDRWR